MLASICLFTALSLSASAQTPKAKRGEKEAPSKEQRIENQTKRLSKKLYLNDSEAAKFESTYKAYAEALEATKMNQGDRPAKGAQLTDSQKDAMATKRFKAMKSQSEIKEKYYKEFRKFLTPEQTAEIFKNNNGKRQNATKRDCEKKCPKKKK